MKHPYTEHDPTGPRQGVSCVDCTTEKAHYTLADVGCYVDGARGIYAVDRIVEIAREHGMAEPASCDHSEFAKCEFVGEIEDECDEYMNGQHAVDGASWGRSDQGDWGLWPLLSPEEEG